MYLFSHKNHFLSDQDPSRPEDFNQNGSQPPQEMNSDESENELPVSDLEQKLEETSGKLAETHDRMLRIAADFDNARKRWEKERIDVRTYSIQEFAKDLLPVIDAFDKAMNAIESCAINPDTEEGKMVAAVTDGVKLVSKVFLDTLKKNGIEKLPGQGEVFNPSYHSAVAKIVDETVTQDTVIDEYTPGYKIGDRVLRTAMVRVATKD